MTTWVKLESTAGPWVHDVTSQQASVLRSSPRSWNGLVVTLDGKQQRDLDSGDSSYLLLRLTRNDVALLASALRETLEAVEDWEFETRVGESRDRAREALRILWQAYDETRPPQT